MTEFYTICNTIAGSRAYGTAMPDSDYDYRGIFCADPINIRTPFFPIREKIDMSENDCVTYEVSNFMKLCLQCNPNIVELLWCDPVDVIHSTPEYQLLREHRDKFLSQKIAYTTSGYAFSQLKRIKGHNKWINNPQPKNPPAIENFISLIQNFTPKKIFNNTFTLPQKGYMLLSYGNNIYGAYKQPEAYTYKDNQLISYDRKEIDDDKHPDFLIKFNAEEFKRQKEKHKQYWNWKKNRNPKRSALEEKYGYDTKHAQHLVRLLRMGVEALTTGRLIVKRPDAAELLEIRNGKWTYEEIIKYANDQEQKIHHLLKTTKLRKKPDIKFAAKILMDIQDMVWNKNV